jgi:hypothetical protein
VTELKDVAIELRNAGGMEAVDKYFDKKHKMVPWEYCYECDCVTPRDLYGMTLKCLFEEEHEE